MGFQLGLDSHRCSSRQNGLASGDACRRSWNPRSLTPSSDEPSPLEGLQDESKRPRAQFSLTIQRIPSRHR
ncbi:MAG: hypothetical protein LLG93_11575 [Deltaproteobacteria bacterium]|nr:hypothetical protein [Deltaproteobacteria bacterium]